MNRYIRSIRAATLAFCIALAPVAAAMSAAAHRDARADIDATYRADAAGCKTRPGNERRVCLQLAQGKQQVDLAQADYHFSLKDSDARKIGLAKARASFALALAVCDGRALVHRQQCRAIARHTFQETLTGLHAASPPLSGSFEDTRYGNFRLAREACARLDDEAQAVCINLARARFKRS